MDKCVYLYISMLFKSENNNMGALIKDFLSNKLRPVLKLRGYVKKGNSFLRQSGDIIYIINIQGSSWNWEGNETFYVNVGIVSTAVENAVGHACSIKETSTSKLLYSQVSLRAEELVPIKNKSYTISETENADQCLSDIILVDEQFNQIQCIEDLYPLLSKSYGSKPIWESTYMRFWAMNGDWAKFDKILDEHARWCKEKEIETLLMKEGKSLCQKYGHKHPAIPY